MKDEKTLGNDLPEEPEEQWEPDEEETEADEAEMESDAAEGVVIENFDDDKDIDDELYQRYVDVMNQQAEEEEDIAAVAERITGERHSKVSTAAPLRIRSTSAAYDDPQGTMTIGMAGLTQTLDRAELSDHAVPAAKKKKVNYPAVVTAAVLALLLMVTTVTILVSVVSDREEPAVVPDPVPGTAETLEIPEETEEILPEDGIPEEEELPETEEILPEIVPEEEVTEPEPEIVPEPEPEPVVPQYTVTLDFYDRDDITTTVTQMTLADVYRAVGYTPRESDRPAVGLDFLIAADAWITIGTAEYKSVNVTEAVPYTSEIIEVDTIPRGEKQYIRAGENGEITRTYTVEYVNGVETNRTLASEQTTKWPVTEQYQLGVGGTFTNVNGITYTYSYRRVVPATYYSLEGLTYLGQMADESVIAVDPNNIPLGTKVYVRNDTYDFGIRVAADTGPKVDEWQIDIWLSPYNWQYESFAAVGYHNDMEIYYLD